MAMNFWDPKAADEQRNPALMTEVKDTGFKHDASGTPAGPYGHGYSGLFNQVGTDRRVFNAMLTHTGGLLQALPVIYNDMLDSDFGGFNNEFYSILTGVTAGAQSVANQPTTPCGAFPGAGLMKLCTQVSPFARYGQRLRELDLERVGKLANPADPTYLQFMGSLGENQLFGPNTPPALRNFMLNEFTRRAYEGRVEFHRWVSRRLWNGDPTNSSASNGWKDLVGMNLLINEGNKRDFTTGSVCSAADSKIHNFQLNLVNGTVDIVGAIDQMYYNLWQWNAPRMGLSPVKGALVMTPGLFEELVKIWPVRYYTEMLTSMAAFTAGRITITANEAVEARDAMRSGKYLPIRGEPVPIILDEGITEYDVNTLAGLTAGTYASDIYFVPLTVMGGIPATYLTPYRQDNPIAEAIVRDGRAMMTWTSDGGIFRWYVEQTRNCLNWEFHTEFRLVMRTTQLAGRITNVAYRPLWHVRSAYPDSAYFADGGATTGQTQTGYVNWTSTPVVFQ